jgi:hypothetical protein
MMRNNENKVETDDHENDAFFHDHSGPSISGEYLLGAKYILRQIESATISQDCLTDTVSPSGVNSSISNALITRAISVFLTCMCF